MSVHKKQLGFSLIMVHHGIPRNCLPRHVNHDPSSVVSIESEKDKILAKRSAFQKVALSGFRDYLQRNA